MAKRAIIFLAVILGLMLLYGVQLNVTAQSGITVERIGIVGGEVTEEPLGMSFDPDVSADGRYVAFASLAYNLVPNDTNEAPDIFVYDRQTGLNTRVSVSPDGEQALGWSENPILSDDGRYVLFQSNFSGLIAGAGQYYIHDRQAGITSAAVVALDGSPLDVESFSFALSADGQILAFDSSLSSLVPGDSNFVYDVFAHDRATRQIARISVASDGTQANEASFVGSISANGRFVTLVSSATNLVSGDTNTCLHYPQPGRCPDIFLHDRQTGQTTRVSVASDGTQGNSRSAGTSQVTDDGRFVAFESLATNLVADDANTFADVFVHDRQTGQTTLVSRASDGTLANNSSAVIGISPDGRYVAFESLATNLVAGDSNNEKDVFVHDRQTGQTVRVMTAAYDLYSSFMEWFNDVETSPDQNWMVFGSAAPDILPNVVSNPNIYIYDRQAGEYSRVSNPDPTIFGNGDSFNPVISGDGRYVAFDSSLVGLVPGDTIRGDFDVFIRDRQSGQTHLIESGFSPAISTDGSTVTYYADNTGAGTNQIYAYDLQTQATTLVSRSSAGTTGDGDSLSSSLSADGRYVAFSSAASNLVSSDTNAQIDIFVHDRQTGQTTRVSRSTSGAQADADCQRPSISANGRYIVFDSRSSMLSSDDTNTVSDVFVHDRDTGETTLVSVASNGAQSAGYSFAGGLSADGRFVVFTSYSNMLVGGYTNNKPDLFVHDRQTGQTQRISVASDGTQSNHYSYNPSISGDGRYVAFLSMATNLAPNDTNHVTDAFVHDRQTGKTIRVSVAADGTESNSKILEPLALAANSAFVSFATFATNLVPDDNNIDTDIFVVSLPDDFGPDIAPQITSSPPLDGALGVAYSHTFTATGTAPITWELGGTLPDGLTWNAGTATLSGTPTRADLFEGLTATASNSEGSDAQPFDIEIFAPSAPDITSDPPPAGTVNVAYSHTFTASGFPVPTITLSGPLPTGLTWNAGTATISGTPTTAGIFSPLTATATNSEGTDTQNFAIEIFGAPDITSAPPPNGTVNIAYNHTFAAAGSTPITWELSGTLPDGLTWNAPLAKISGTPTTASISGSITVTATNSIGSDTQTFSITIADAVAPDITSALPPNGITGQVYAHTFTATGTAPITWDLTGTLPAGLMWNAGLARISGTPTTAGTSASITVTASNSAGTDEQIFTITISAPPDITSALPPNGVVGQPYSHSFTATGTPPLTWELSGTLPPGLVWNAGAATINGTPLLAGQYPAISVTVTNSAGSDAQPFTLSIPSAPNAAPQRGYFTPATPALTWARMTGVTTFTLQIARNAGFSSGLQTFSGIAGTETSYTLPALTDGLYYWRVRGIYGPRVGGWSRVESFFVNAP